MSYRSLSIASRDQALVNRIVACVQREAWVNEVAAGSEFGATVRANPAEGARLIWPVVVSTETEYAYALAQSTPDPGGNEGVVTDAAILAVVQAEWPQDTP